MDYEKEKEKLDREIEDIKRDLKYIPGGHWAIIVGLCISFLICFSAFFSLWVAGTGLLIISGLMYFAIHGIIDKPEIISVVSSAFAGIPIFMIIFIILGCVFWGITSLILLFL